MYGLKPVPFKLKLVPFKLKPVAFKLKLVLVKLKPVPVRLKPAPFRLSHCQCFGGLADRGADGYADCWLYALDLAVL
jgi:hypothetical protein